MYTTNDRFTRAKKQAEVYRRLASVATAISDNIDKVAGKIYDKRVIEALDQIAAEFGCHVYGNKFNMIEISDFNHRDYKLDGGCTGYIDNYSVQVRGFDTTPGGKLRVNGEDLSHDCFYAADNLQRDAEHLDGFEAVYGQMIEDLNEDLTILSWFKAKYDSTYRELAGIDFSVRNNSSSTNWDVHWIY